MPYFIAAHHLWLLEFSDPAIGRFAFADIAALPILASLADTWLGISPKMAVASPLTINRVRP